MKSIQLLVLTNGQVLIGEVSIESGIYYIKKPLSLALQIGHDGNLNVQMMDYLPISSDNEFTFRRENVMTMATPQKNLEKTYRQKMSGLVLPEGPQLIT